MTRARNFGNGGGWATMLEAATSVYRILLCVLATNDLLTVSCHVF
jgi:hypothetical protein